MSQIETPLVRYIFLDIVSFTQNRSVEAQADLVRYSNQIICDALAARIGSDFRDNGNVILLPTGDGVCIALVELKPFDIHIQIALEILSRVATHNSETKDEARRFLFRIGINQNEDTLVQGINGKRNVAGNGINIAQRVMNTGDGGHILLGQPAYDILRGREAYMSHLVTYEAIDKHGNKFPIHQYVNKELEYLNSSLPNKLADKPKEKQILNEIVARFMEIALLNKDFLISRRDEHRFSEIGTVLLYFLALDMMEQLAAGEYDRLYPITIEGTFEEKYEYYSKADRQILRHLAKRIETSDLNGYWGCFEVIDYATAWPIVSRQGEVRLAEEKPEVYADFLAEIELKRKIK